MGHARRSFDWLVGHEKILMLATLALIVAVVLQLRFCGSDVSSTVSASQPQTLTNSSAGTPGRLTGTWEMSLAKPKGGVQNWTLTLTQNGEDLSGALTSEGGDLPVSGKVKGDEVSLSAKKFGVTVAFPAKVEGETMTGTMKALMITRKWTAKRK